MIYNCKSYDDYEGTLEEWTCQIKKLINFNKCCEVVIEARGSSLNIIVGKTENDVFICIPDQSFGCFLSNFRDKDWNTNRLEKSIDIADAITIAKGLYELYDRGII